MDTPDRYTDAYLADNELRQSDVVTVSPKKAANPARDAAKHRAVYPHSLKTMFIDKVKKTVRPGQPEECHTFGATFNNAVRWAEGEIATLDVDNSKFSASTARSWISDWKSNPTGWLQKSRGPIPFFDLKSVKKIKSFLAAARQGAKTVSHAMAGAAMRAFVALKCPQILPNNNAGVGLKVTRPMVCRVLELAGYKLYSPTTTRTMSALTILRTSPKYYASMKKFPVDPRLFDNMDYYISI